MDKAYNIYIYTYIPKIEVIMSLRYSIVVYF